MMEKRYKILAVDANGHRSNWEERAGSKAEARAKFKQHHVNLKIDEVYEL